MNINWLENYSQTVTAYDLFCLFLFENFVREGLRLKSLHSLEAFLPFSAALRRKNVINFTKQSEPENLL